MISKKKEFFLLFFLVFLQSCSGSRIGNFLESSFSDLEKISPVENLQKKSINKKNVVKENKEDNNKNYEKIKKVEKPINVLESKKNVAKENKEDNNKNYEKIKKVEKPKSILKNIKDINYEKIQKQKNNKIKNPSKNRKIKLQSYKIIFILKDVDPKDPTENLSNILRNSEVNFEIEKIERILNSKNQSMKKN